MSSFYKSHLLDRLKIIINYVTTDYVEKQNVSPNDNVTRYYNIDCYRSVINSLLTGSGVSMEQTSIW